MHARLRPARAPIALAVSLLAVAVLLLGGLGAVAQDATPTASGEPLAVPLIDAGGGDAGSATFTANADGSVTVAVSISGLEEGAHGIHLHAMGVCDPTGEQPFSTAGPHFNPTGGMHDGAPMGDEVATPGGDTMKHAGDLGNIEVGQDGSGSLEVTTSRFTLGDGPTSVFDEDGTAIVIHKGEDNLVSQPAGDSGGREVCGVVAAPAQPIGSPVPSAPTVTSVEAHVINPEQVPFSDDLLANLNVPDGFEISVYAQGLDNPRMLAYGPDGTLYVTEPNANSVLGLRDTDGDGTADDSFVAASGLAFVHGIAFHEGKVYLAGEKQVWVASIRTSGSFTDPEVVLDNLPDGDQHFRRTVQIGPDNKLYVGLGSSCNVCIESNKENATILRADLDGSNREIFASGLRNTMGFAWEPETGELYGWDQGSDFRGDDQPPEELNRIVEAGNYGWPFCFDDQQIDTYGPYKPQGATLDEYCANTLAPVLTYTAHGSPIAFVFYGGDSFPADYQGDAFVAMRGSWNREPVSGYEVVRVHFEAGKPVSTESFASGWLLNDGGGQFGRIAGLVVDQDGALLISDDTNGVIYRVTYTGS